MEDAGALPIEFDCSNLAMGDVIDVYPYAGKVCKHGTDEVITTFELKTDVLLDEVRAGGRIPLIIGRGMTEKARAVTGPDRKCPRLNSSHQCTTRMTTYA